MTRRLLNLTIAALVAALLLAIPAVPQSAPLKVVASNGMKAVLEVMQPQIEKSLNRKLAIQWGTTTVLKQKVISGEIFDLAVMTTPAIDDLIREQKLAAATRADLARGGIGVGFKKGAPKPDVSTVDAFKKTMKNAKSITYAQDGASWPFIQKMLAKWGTTDEFTKKAQPVNGSDASTGLVAQGKADLVLTLVSEILPVKGIELAGPFPKEEQNYVYFAGAASAKSTNADAAKAALKFLTGPEAASVYKIKGMEPGK
jgi:molybdate transport system substrate-binding protein